MRITRLSLGLLFVAVVAVVAAGEEAAPKEPAPKGTVTKYQFAASTVFPGTVRDYWVYVPQQYDAAKPACVYVNQDGIQNKAPAVFDRLIADQQMPVTIGVFVMHGRVVAPSGEALDRFNRSYEYDGLGDAYARFLLDELLPHIAKEQRLNLSSDGNDRCIGGSSSGAVCAFTAAWERPDAFTRVFSTIGTYVGLRGANVYPTLLRKYEPKPLRIYLQDGSNDLNIYGGDWWMANQEMERSLVFAGYQVDHAWGTGGHDGKQAGEIFPDAMRFLWKGWPERVKPGAGSPQLQAIVLPGEGWQVVAEGLGASTGAAVSASGEVVVADPVTGRAWRIGAEGKPVALAGDAKGTAGSRFGPDGRRFAVTAERVVAIDAAGAATVVADGIRGHDLVVRHDGGVYVAAPDRERGQPGALWFFDAKGGKRVVDAALTATGGLALSPDQSLLYVADATSHWVWSYQVQADGGLAHKQRYYHLHVPDDADDSGAQAMRVDRDGRLYVATRLGIQVCDQAGRVNVILPIAQGRPTDLTFGGEHLDTLYALCGGTVVKRRMKIRGCEGAAAPVKPAAPRL